MQRKVLAVRNVNNAAISEMNSDRLGLIDVLSESGGADHDRDNLKGRVLNFNSPAFDPNGAPVIF